MGIERNITSRHTPWDPAHWAIQRGRSGRCPVTPHKKLFVKSPFGNLKNCIKGILKSIEMGIA